MEGTISEGHSEGRVESGSAGSSRGSTWRERKQKRREDGSVNKWRNTLALEKGRIKRSKQYRVPRGMTNTIKETKKLSCYTGW